MSTPVIRLPKPWQLLAAALLLAAGRIALGADTGYPAHRPVVMGTQGMVAANNPLAAEAGLDVLRRGGNAVDAAIATAAVLNVVEPMMSGMAGSAFMLVYDSASGRLDALNASDVAPAAASLERFEAADMSSGLHLATVPGSFDAWAEALARYGTMGWDNVLRPAIAYAEQGVPYTNFFVEQIGFAADHFRKYPESARLFLRDGEVPRPGDIHRNPGLARTMRAVVSAADARDEDGRGAAIRAGRDEFYKGSIAAAIADFHALHGGLTTREDLAAYRAEWADPACSAYRGLNVCSAPPNTSGVVMLEALEILEGYDLGSLGYGSADYLHVLAETFKLVRADRAAWIGDPRLYSDPRDRMLDEKYVASQRARIDMGAAKDVPGSQVEQANTTHISVVDGDGNVVSFTTTMGGGTALFGTLVVLGDTGLVSVDGINWMDRDPDSINRIRGGVRPRWSMSPTIVFQGGKPWLAIGTPGGEGIWQTIPQALVNIVDFRMNVQQAIEAPRIRTYAGLDLRAESRIDASVRQDLSERGHRVTALPAWTQEVGGMNAIMIDPETGVLMGGADPRREGYVIAW
ncbi:MAG: gamma-glutamyltransferase [Gammaproteobacteria bacterium]|nr:gamma-glutamyltransferase [Gammaproteobacteria bacterium]